MATKHPATHSFTKLVVDDLDAMADYYCSAFGLHRGSRDQFEDGVGGESIDDDGFWDGLREHTLPFFSGTTPLWRLSVPPGTPPLAIEGDTFIDWGGALRWLPVWFSPIAMCGPSRDYCVLSVAQAIVSP